MSNIARAIIPAVALTFLAVAIPASAQDPKPKVVRSKPAQPVEIGGVPCAAGYVFREEGTGRGSGVTATQLVSRGRAIISAVAHLPLSLDTAPDVERRQIEAWRHMPSVDKAALITGLTRAAFAMTAAGVRHRHPDATPREHFLRVAVIVLGAELARKAYPDAIEVIDR